MNSRIALLPAALAASSVCSTAHAHVPIFSVPGRAFAIANAGDVDADGTPDLVVGIPDAGPGSRGQAKVWSGRTHAVLWTFSGDADGDQAGYSVAGAGDLNGDGHADVAVGINASDVAFPNGGIVRIYSGSSGLVLREYRGVASSVSFGYSLAKIRDCNQDGIPELAVGAPYDVGPGVPGSVSVFSGANGALLWKVYGANHHDVFGVSIADLGDVNGDGRTDLLVGANQSDGTGPGYAMILSSLDGSVLRTLLGDAPGDRFGSAVAGGGDFNLDGVPDFVVGAPLATGGGPNFGLTRAFSGVDGSVLRSTRLFGQFGSAVTVLEDLDSDGAADYAAGAPTWNGGVALVLSGRTGKLLRRFNALSPTDMLGGSLAAAGDVNGDSKPDLAIGARSGSLFGGGVGYVSVFGVPVVSALH